MSVREDIVAEALSWIGTPFHDCAGIKGVGTDCANFPYGVVVSLGLGPARRIPPYSPQVMMHSNAELFVPIVLEYANELPPDSTILPADLVLWKMGRSFSHGAIIIDWPRVVHACSPHGVIRDDALRNPRLSSKPRRFFRLKILANE